MRNSDVQVEFQLAYVRSLELVKLIELEFVEPEEDYSKSSSSPFFPRLEKLDLCGLPNMKRWRKKTTPTTPLALPLLSHLSISGCRLLELASFPQCPRLQKIDLWDVDNSDNGGGMQYPLLPSTLFCPFVSPPPLQNVTIWDCNWLPNLQGDATASLRQLSISACSILESLHLASPHLQRVHISRCKELVSLEAATATPYLTELTIHSCEKFKILSICAPLNALRELTITSCRELDFLKLELEWDFMVNLRKLVLRPMPPMENIPLSLHNRQALGQLRITDWD